MGSPLPLLRPPAALCTARLALLLTLAALALPSAAGTAGASPPPSILAVEQFRARHAVGAGMGHSGAFRARPGALPHARAPRSLPALRGGVRKGPSPTTLSNLPFTGCAEWTIAMPDSTPFVGSDHAMIYDPVRDQLVAYAANPYAVVPTSEVWVCPFVGTPQWMKVPTTGTAPSSRLGATAILDAPRDRMILYGGSDGGGEAFALSLSTGAWTLLAPSGTAPVRMGHSAIFDAPRNRMVVYGGYDQVGVPGDAWALELSGPPAWSQLAPTGTPPAARYAHVAIFDAPRNRMIVHGGYDGNAGVYLGDVWSLTLSGTPAWTALSPSGTAPFPRLEHAALFDAPNNRMVVFGGFADHGVDGFFDMNDLWSLPMTGTLKWTKLNPSGTLPPLVEQHAIVYDAARSRLVSHGGFPYGPDELWTVNLSGSPVWSQIVPANQGPRGRMEHIALYDAPRQRVVVYGGLGENSWQMRDTWALATNGTPAWTRLTPTGTAPLRSAATAIVDSVRSRIVLFGGVDDLGYPFNDAWALSLTGTPAWTHLNPSGTDPAARTFAVAIADPTRTRMVMYGGYDTDGMILTDTWALSLSGGGSWTELNPSGPIPTIPRPIALFDRPRDRMLLLGYGDSGTIEVWSLAFAGAGTWSLLLSDPNVYYRDGSTAVLDLARNRLLLMVPFEPVRALPLTGPATWQRIGSPDPPAFEEHAAAVFDAQNDRALLIGGRDLVNGELTNRAYALGFPSNLRTLNASAYPEVVGSVDLSPPGGCYPLNSVATLTVYIEPGFHLDNWTGDAAGADNPLQLTMDDAKTVVANLAQPPPSCDGWRRILGASGVLAAYGAYATVSDPLRHRVVTIVRALDADSLEMWALPTSGGPQDWAHLTTLGPNPGGRSDMRVVYDPVRDRVLLYGGQYPFATILTDVWTLSLAGTPTWSQLTATGAPPSPRVLGSVTYDPVRDRIIVFAGRPSPFGGSGVNEVNALSLSGTPAWSTLSPAGPLPAGRAGHEAIYDPVRDRLVIFGGFGTPTAPRNDVWALSLAGSPAWTSIAPAGVAPEARGLSGSIYDPLRDRMLVYSGSQWDYTASGPGFSAVLADVHVLSFKHGPAWMRLTPDGTLPGARAQCGVTYDAENDRMIVVNGVGLIYGGPGSTYFTDPHDTHALSLAGGYWLHLVMETPSQGTLSRSPQADCYAPGTPVEVTSTPTQPYWEPTWLGDASGTDNPLSLIMDGNKAIQARLASVVGVDEDLPTRFAFDAAKPNPAAGPTTIEFSLPRSAAVELRVYDVSGRLMRTLVQGEKPPGRHTIEWVGDDDDGHRVGIGVYFCRLRAGDFEETRRIIRIE